MKQIHCLSISDAKEVNTIHLLCSILNFDEKIGLESIHCRSSMSTSMFSTNRILGVLSFLLLLLHHCDCLSHGETYKEELYIRPLPNGHTYFNLLFTTVASPTLLKSNIGRSTPSAIRPVFIARLCFSTSLSSLSQSDRRCCSFQRSG